MKIISPIYQNMNLKFNGTMIVFKNGKAEVPEEVYEAIVKSGFPNIFKEGQSPGIKSNERKEYDTALKDVNEEYMIEIDRLKRVINAKNQEIIELKEQVNVWKTQYNTDVSKLKTQLSSITVESSKVEKTIDPSPTKEELEISPVDEEEKALRDDLESMKMADLQTLAIKEGISEDKVKKAGTKKVLIDLIIGKE